MCLQRTAVSLVVDVSAGNMTTHCTYRNGCTGTGTPTTFTNTRLKFIEPSCGGTLCTSLHTPFNDFMISYRKANIL